MNNLPPHLRKMQKIVDAEDAKHADGEVNEEQKPSAPVETEEKPPIEVKPHLEVDQHQKKDEHRDVKPKKKKPFEDDSEETWKARYAALKGKYDNEIPSLQTQLRNASNELGQTRSSIVELQKKLENQEKTASSVQPPKIDIPDDLSSLLSKDDAAYLNDEIGLDQKAVNIIGKMMGKIPSATPPPASTELPSEFEDLKRDAQVVRQSRYDEYWKKFSAAVPDFKEIDSSDFFNFDFAHRQVPYANITWKEALDRAQDNLDADKMIGIFNKCKEEMQGKKEPAPFQINPEQLIEPSSTVHTKVDANPQEKTWTLVEAQKVYDDFLHKKISQKEFDRLAAQIDKANLEGRMEKT